MKIKIIEIESCLECPDKGIIGKGCIVRCLYLRKPTPLRGILPDCPLPDKKDVKI